MECVGVAKASPLGGGKHVAGVQVGVAIAPKNFSRFAVKFIDYPWVFLV